MKAKEWLIAAAIIAIIMVAAIYFISQPSSPTGPTTVRPLSKDDFRLFPADLVLGHDNEGYWLIVRIRATHDLNKSIRFLGSTMTLVSVTLPDDTEQQLNVTYQNVTVLTVGIGEAYRLDARFGPFSFKPIRAKILVITYVEGLAEPLELTVDTPLTVSTPQSSVEYCSYLNIDARSQRPCRGARMSFPFRL
ncbi:MAG: hypothetical protein WCC94_05635 [Candidatus Bathyarchaeia archaeon]